MSASLPTPLRVLIIDDSPENRYVVRRALTRAGMEVLEAGTGAEGRSLVGVGPELVDLVVLDVNLPDTTGFELCREIKANPATALVPVIHLSQSAVDDGSQVRGLEGGADAYLTDPVHGSVLVATVRALLRVRQAEELLRRQADDADRLALLNTRLAAASTESEVIAALLETLNDPYTVRRAYWFGPRPWIRRPELVFPPEGGFVAVTPPVNPIVLERMLDEALDSTNPSARRLFYEPKVPYAWLVLPLIAYGREIGALVIEFAARITLPERNQIRMVPATERTAEVIERARMAEEQRSIAAELQASLLPAQLPEVPGLGIGVCYRAGAEGMVVGGDFYDVFAAAPDGWGMIIGDVCGRGAAAASRTSLARHTAREAARHDGNPVALLAALDGAIKADKRDHLDLISAICLVATTVDGGVRLSFAVAGHPLPILVGADGAAVQVGQPGPILGIDSPAGFGAHEVMLRPGDVLFLYTDGVTEARRGGVLFGEQRLMELLSERVLAGAGVDELAAAPVDAAAAYNEVHDDDMATLVLQAR